jgi:hypothetical protein
MRLSHGYSFRRAFGLGLLSVFGLAVLGAVPAFAWTSALVTTPQPSASVAVGTSISDSASLTLTHESATPSGTVIFYLYAGTCSSTFASGGSLYSSTSTVGSSNNGATVSYSSGSFSTTGKAAGSYVWLVRYSGGGGWPASPSTGPTITGNTSNHYDCEPITLTPPTHGVPEFPVGLPLLLALALPAMILLRRRLPTQ